MIRYNDQTLKQFMLLHDAKAYNEPFLNIQVKHFSMLTSVILLNLIMYKCFTLMCLNPRPTVSVLCVST